MIRRVIPTFLVFVVDAALAVADAGRPERYEQVFVQIAGTTWVADDGSLGRVTYHFLKSGKLHYSYANGTEYHNGNWKQEGHTLYFEVNQQYREFRGSISGQRISGPSWNKSGTRWETTMTPKSK